MSHKEEFNKIKNSFVKVKEDMGKLNDLIVNNTEDFFSHHKKLSDEVMHLSNALKNNLTHHRVEHSNSKDHHKLAEDVKHLKNTISDVVKKNVDFYNLFDRMSKNENNLLEVKKRLDADELEIHILKEKLIEKDFEIKKLKEINVHVVKIIDELREVEEKLLKDKK